MSDDEAEDDAYRRGYNYGRQKAAEEMRERAANLAATKARAIYRHDMDPVRATAHDIADQLADEIRALPLDAAIPHQPPGAALEQEN